MATTLLAIDLGAESGRGMAGRFDGERIHLEQIHRFGNGPVSVLDAAYWDVLGLHRDILDTLRRASSIGELASVGVDTWGVDFALLGRGGTLLGNPRHYRDPHTQGALEIATARVPAAEIYRQTGIQFMRINTLPQLMALQRDRSPQLEAAESLLLMADLFHYFLTGIQAVEFTNASTSQLLDPATGDWAHDLIAGLGLPAKIFGPIVQPGTVLGPLRSAVAKDVGLTAVPVVAPATHDTGSAVAGIPATSEDWAFLSSGTWSLLGMEIPRPITTEEARAANFTNEGGVGGTVRFLKNIMGLWLVQECRRTWERAGQSFGYDELAYRAAAAPAFACLIDPDDASFLLPANMPDAIAAYCRKTGQTPPADAGATVRCCLESLALKYRWTLDVLRRLTGRSIEAIHVVGGGCQNALLCQFTADACQLPVIAGPTEATALGNVLAQAVGLGLVGSWSQARAVARASVGVTRYEPQDGRAWTEAYGRFAAIAHREV